MVYFDLYVTDFFKVPLITFFTLVLKKITLMKTVLAGNFLADANKTHYGTYIEPKNGKFYSNNIVSYRTFRLVIFNLFN